MVKEGKAKQATDHALGPTCSSAVDKLRNLEKQWGERQPFRCGRGRREKKNKKCGNGP